MIDIHVLFHVVNKTKQKEYNLTIQNLKIVKHLAHKVIVKKVHFAVQHLFNFLCRILLIELQSFSFRIHLWHWCLIVRGSFTTFSFFFKSFFLDVRLHAAYFVTCFLFLSFSPFCSWTSMYFSMSSFSFFMRLFSCSRHIFIELFPANTILESNVKLEHNFDEFRFAILNREMDWIVFEFSRFIFLLKISTKSKNPCSLSLLPWGNDRQAFANLEWIGIF